MKLTQKQFNICRMCVGAAAMILTLLFLYTHFEFMYIPSSSMEPTYHVNDVVVLWRTQNIDHRDIVMVSRDGANDYYAKRVIGLPGDTISVHDGKAWRNGEALDEPYLMEPDVRGVKEEVTVPEGMIFCMGDNRNHSTDSRDFGCFEIQNVVGKALFKMP